MAARNSFYGNYSALWKEIERNHKAPKFKVEGRVKISKYPKDFNKGFSINWSGETFVIDSVMKANLWTYKIKDSNG